MGGMMHRGVWAAGIAASGCIGPWIEDPDDVGIDDPQVGFVYVGPVGDHGWTLTHEVGRQEMNAALPEVTSHFEPSVLPSDAVEVMEGFIADGDNIIVTTSFDFLTATQTVAANHPDISFLNCSGFVSSPNLGSYFGRMYQAKYLAGLMAGEMSCTGKVGFVAPVIIPEVVRHVNAFALGVREVNPGAVVYVYWTGSWFDVELEPIATNALVDLGVDVVISGTDTTIPLEVARGRTVTCDDGSATPPEVPVYSIGYDNPDGCDASPETCLTSAYWNWGPMYSRLVGQIAEGTWDPFELVWEQMQTTPEDSVIALAEKNAIVPGPVRIKVDDKIPQLVSADGTHLPFVGPIRDASGAVRFADGDRATDEDLLEMCWYVEGVRNADDPDTVAARVPPGCGGVE